MNEWPTLVRIGIPPACGDDLGHRPRGDQVVEDRRARGLGQFPHGDQCGDGAGRHRLALLVHHEAPVGVAVEREPDVGAGATHLGLQVDEVRRVQRVGLVVGKTAVQVEVQRFETQRQSVEHHGHGQPGHAVAGVHHDMQGPDGGQIDEPAQVLGVVRQQAPTGDGPRCVGQRSGRSVQDGHRVVADRGETGLQAQRHRAGQAELDPVVARRVVRRGEHRSGQVQGAGRVVQQVGGGKAGVDHVQPGGGDPLGQRAGEFRRGLPHVVCDDHGTGGRRRRTGRTPRRGPGPCSG